MSIAEVIGFSHSNLHTHTQFCDGQSTMEETAYAAVDAAIGVLGFSPHSPATYDDAAMSISSVPAYLDELDRLRGVFTGKLRILAGMEQDALAPVGAFGLDYIIGAVHYVKDHAGGIHCVDYTQEKMMRAIEAFGSAEALVMAYAETYATMLKEYRPLIAGHMDIITKLNTGNYFFDTDSDWYHRVEEMLAKAVRESGAIVEINTAGMARNGGEQPYPGRYLLNELHRLGVPVTLSSDAHHARNIARFFPSAIELLRDVGFSSIKVYGAEGFCDHPIG